MNRREILCRQLIQLFPKGFYDEKLARLSIESFQDGGNHFAPLFESDHNKNFLEPLVRQLSGRLENLGTDSKKKLLSKSQDFLKTLVECFYGPNGVPPRAWQTAALLYRPHNQFPRNVYITDRTCYIGRPPAKQAARTWYSAFWALQEPVGKCLLLYLGVFRPVEQKIAAQLTPGRLASEMSNYIFTRPLTRGIHKVSIRWTGSMVNAALRRTGSILPVEARAYRHLMKAFSRKHLRTFMNNLTPGTEEDDLPSQLALSRHTHLVLGLCSGPAIKPVSFVEGEIPPELRAFAQHTVCNLLEARQWPDGHLKRRSQEVLGALRSWSGGELPFSPGTPLYSAIVRMSSYLCFGGMQTGVIEVSPFMGYPPSLIASALGMVRIMLPNSPDLLTRRQVHTTVKQWKSGAFVAYHPGAFLERFKALESDYQLKIEVFQSSKVFQQQLLKLANDISDHSKSTSISIASVPVVPIIPHTQFFEVSPLPDPPYHLKRRNLKDLVNGCGDAMDVDELA